MEPGYEADAEQDNGLSDVSGKGSGNYAIRLRKTREKPKRRTDSFERYILYPYMCEQLIYFIEHDCDSAL